MLQCSSIPPLLPQMMSVSLPVTAAPTSSLCVMFSHLRYFLSLSCEGVRSPSLRRSGLCSTGASCLPISVTISVCCRLCFLQQLASFLILLPTLQDSVATYLYYYALKNMPVCVCANISILWRLPVGMWDRLISWLASCPGSSPFRLSIYSNLSISFPLPT